MPVELQELEKEGFIVSNIPEPTYGEWEAIQIRSEVELEHLVKKWRV